MLDCWTAGQGYPTNKLFDVTSAKRLKEQSEKPEEGSQNPHKLFA